MSKHLKQRLKRICRRAIRSGRLTVSQFQAVEACMASDAGMDELALRIERMPAYMTVGRSERVVLNWLWEHIDDIVRFIMAIVAMLGLL